MKNCSKCGQENLDTDQFCKSCGASLEQTPQAETTAPAENATPAHAHAPYADGSAHRGGKIPPEHQNPS